MQLIEAMRSATAGLPLPEVIEHVIEHSGLKRITSSEKEGADRLENLDELVNAAAVFVDERATQMPAEGDAARAMDTDRLSRPCRAGGRRAPGGRPGPTRCS